MISDLAILVALINNSILLVITSLGIHKMRVFTNNTGGKPDTQGAKNLSRVQIFIQIIYLFLIVGIITRLSYIFLFPFEYTKIQLSLPSDSINVIWLVIQTLFLAFHVFLFVILVITQNLIPHKRYTFIIKVLKISLFIFLFDILISFILYIQVTMHNVLPWFHLVSGKIKGPMADFSNTVSLVVLFSLMLFLIVFFIKLRSENRILAVLFNVLFVLTVGINIVVLLYSLSVTLDSSLGFIFFTTQKGFTAQIWLFLILITIGSQWLIAIILKLDNAFMNSNYGLNLRIQLRTISVTALTLLSMIAIWLPLLKVIYS